MTEPKTKLKRREKSELKGRMRSFLMFLPNMVMLLGRLLKDARVPTAEKALFLAAIVYVISPIDFIPDVFPFIGQVDDIYVVALTLLVLAERPDSPGVGMVPPPTMPASEMVWCGLRNGRVLRSDSPALSRPTAE